MDDSIISLVLIIVGVLLVSYGAWVIMSVWFGRIKKSKILLHGIAIVSMILGALSLGGCLSIAMGDTTLLPGQDPNEPFITGLFVALVLMVLELAGFAATFWDEQKKKKSA